MQLLCFGPPFISLTLINEILFYGSLLQQFFVTDPSGFRGVRSAPNPAMSSKPAQADMVPFEVKMADFPELAGVSLGKAGPPLVQKECWGPAPSSTSPQTQTSAPAWKVNYQF